MLWRRHYLNDPIHIEFYLSEEPRIGHTPCIPEKLLLWFRGLEKAEVCLALSHLKLPNQDRSAPASMPSYSTMTAEYHAFATRELEALLEKERIASAAHDREMQARDAALKEKWGSLKELQDDLERALIPTHLRCIAAVALQHIS